MANNNKVKLQTIKCPKCGKHYLPAEIYYPAEFFGKPSQIERNNKGEVEFFNGESLNLSETFTCTHCDTNFEVIADISFSTKITELGEFEDFYITPLFDDKLELDEDFE